MGGTRQDDRFKLEISTTHKADVYMSRPNLDIVAWPLVKALDQAGIRAIGDAPDLKPDGNHTRAIMSECSGFAHCIALPPSRTLHDISGIAR